MRERPIVCAFVAVLALSIAGLTITRPACADMVTSRNFHFTFLSGDEEVPQVQSNAFGFTAIRETANRDAIVFLLFTVGLTDVTQAHIHIGPRGENGPVAVFLFSSLDNPVTANGPLSAGVITADDLIGPLADQPISKLIDEINAGNAYVNVHTVGHASGEIRGQINSAQSPIN